MLTKYSLYYISARLVSLVYEVFNVGILDLQVDEQQGYISFYIENPFAPHRHIPVGIRSDGILKSAEEYVSVIGRDIQHFYNYLSSCHGEEAAFYSQLIELSDNYREPFLDRVQDYWNR